MRMNGLFFIVLWKVEGTKDSQVPFVCFVWFLHKWYLREGKWIKSIFFTYFMYRFKNIKILSLLNFFIGGIFFFSESNLLMTVGLSKFYIFCCMKFKKLYFPGNVFVYVFKFSTKAVYMLAREAGKLPADFHLSLCSFRPSPTV